MGKHPAYYEDVYVREITTRLLSQEEREGKYYCVLEDTLFFPGGGGQPCDQGHLSERVVESVFEKDGVIYHVLNEPLNCQEVLCSIDFSLRWGHMQHHTGQHLLSAVLQREYGMRTHSVHIQSNYATIDVEHAGFTRGVLDSIEARVATYIASALWIETTLEEEESLSVPVKKKLRKVGFQGFEASFCCGTHLRSTAELGLLKIEKTEKIRGLTRLHFLCGDQALRDYQAKSTLLGLLSRHYSSCEKDIWSRIQKEEEEKRDLLLQGKALRKKLVAYQVRDLVQNASSCLLETEEASAKEAQELSLLLAKEGDYLAAVSYEETLYLAHNGTLPLHLGDFVKTHAKALGGVGGGSQKSAQVRFPSKEEGLGFRVLLQREVAVLFSV